MQKSDYMWIITPNDFHQLRYSIFRKNGDKNIENSEDNPASSSSFIIPYTQHIKSIYWNFLLSYNKHSFSINVKSVKLQQFSL